MHKGENLSKKFNEVSVVIEPIKEISFKRSQASVAPVKEVTIEEVSINSSNNMKKESANENNEEEKDNRSVLTSNQPSIETKRDKRALITNEANSQIRGVRSNNTLVTNDSSSLIKKNDENDEVTSGPSTPVKRKVYKY